MLTSSLKLRSPSEGKRFRLLAHDSKYAVYSRAENEPLVGHYLGPGPDLHVDLHMERTTARAFMPLGAGLAARCSSRAQTVHPTLVTLTERVTTTTSKRTTRPHQTDDNVAD